MLSFLAAAQSPLSSLTDTIVVVVVVVVVVVDHLTHFHQMPLVF